MVELLQPDRVSVLGVVLQQGLRFAATWHPGSSRILRFFCLLLLVNVVPWDGCGGCRVSYNPNSTTESERFTARLVAAEAVLPKAAFPVRDVLEEWARDVKRHACKGIEA